MKRIVSLLLVLAIMIVGVLNMPVIAQSDEGNVSQVETEPTVYSNVTDANETAPTNTNETVSTDTNETTPIPIPESTVELSYDITASNGIRAISLAEQPTYMHEMKLKADGPTHVVQEATFEPVSLDVVYGLNTLPNPTRLTSSYAFSQNTIVLARDQNTSKVYDYGAVGASVSGYSGSTAVLQDEVNYEDQELTHATAIQTVNGRSRANIGIITPNVTVKYRAIGGYINMTAIQRWSYPPQMPATTPEPNGLVPLCVWQHHLRYPIFD